MAKKRSTTATSPAKNSSKRRKRLSQSDVPAYSLQQALRVCNNLVQNHDGDAISPLQLAQDLNVAPTSGPFRMLCGASIAYGLTLGGYNAEEVSMDTLGKRIVQSVEEGDDALAMREALLRPRVIREFLEKYNGSPIPPDQIASNVLADMGVPRDRTEAVLSLIVDGAVAVGFVREIKDKKYVDLGAKPVAIESPQLQQEADSDQVSTIVDSADEENFIEEMPLNGKPATASGQTATRESADPELPKRVFITHGKNKAFLAPIKKLLGFGEMIPVVSVEKQSVSKPVPDKVMDDMRSCGAAIIHVDAETKLIDNEANEHVVVNPNVLMEIGAAFALYGRRFILLVKSGVELPSNLQGLYEVRYTGDSLDGDATIRLLEAINDIKNNPLPKRD